LHKAKRLHVLGSEGFREHVQQKTAASSEAPGAQRHVVRPGLDEISSGTPDRGEWMAAAYRQHVYTMREIASYVGVHYSLVSKLIKAREERVYSTFKT